ncbi:hypothetical protein [Streptomyces flaveolus]|jgi:hypothetical protein|uniref:hypothetical protein n=1 Tax=Streptomyces flaveolus TaxID=67297 RepID=UPI001670AC33|nr:hypothetical protein [Streptomyces flaveolus]GGQ85752.1 hypothetical protein GCM10010216_54590 [Streptomyces flaveolus]
MAINESVTGNDSVAITGTATPGERTVGVGGRGDAVGVQGKGARWHGVEGVSSSEIGGAGVYGAGASGGAGVVGETSGRFNPAVYGKHSGSEGIGVLGEADNGAGTAGKSKSWVGVHGSSESTTGGSGVWGEHKGAGTGTIGFSAQGVGVHGRGGRLAGFFEGNVEVTGDLVLTGGDVAEQFDVAVQGTGTDRLGPGTVVTFDDEGALTPCADAYDRRVAGVVSGAGDRVPALVLDRREPGAGRAGTVRQAVAVTGKVWSRADASSRPIHVGDLLTTSPTPGHTMVATDRDAAFGAVLGKALTPLVSGTGMVLVLVGLG